MRLRLTVSAVAAAAVIRPRHLMQPPVGKLDRARSDLRHGEGVSHSAVELEDFTWFRLNQHQVLVS